jgi:uncharacterized iron-regulated membrane protein
MARPGLTGRSSEAEPSRVSMRLVRQSLLRARIDRQLFVLLHRWIGLTTAIFLVIAGLTGALLAFNDELDAALNPQLFRAAPPGPDTPALDPLLLREQVQVRFPGTWLHDVPLVLELGRATVFFLDSPADPATGKPAELPNNQIFVNPYTGDVQGARRWGDITQGWKNLMPFVYRLHYSLALDAAGGYLIGAVALLWTVDCFVGACLTLPIRRRTRSEVAEKPTARPASAPAMLNVPPCTPALLGAETGRSLRFFHNL